MRTTDTMVLFWNGFMSNWYTCSFYDDGVLFVSSEQHFMYQKAMCFNDIYIAEKILATNDPGEQKHLGREISWYHHTIWTNVRFAAMVQSNRLKYAQNRDLLRKLLDTGTKILVEASPYDTIWGIGLREEDDDALDQTKWRGQNLLGQALMQVREEFRGLV